MINIAILDDSQNDIQNLKKLLSNFAKTSKEQFSVDCYNRGLTFLDNLKKKYDIVFFDIDASDEWFRSSKEITSTRR